MFKFNFHVDSDEGGLMQDKAETEPQEKDSSPSIECYESEKVEPEDKHFENLDIYTAGSTSAEYGSTEIHYLLTESVNEILSEKGVDINRANENHSDLIPGIYEGGAKIWECTEDLLEYMSHKLDADFFKDKRVLDLGCGAGLLGIYTLNNNSKVEFQDYNRDVLQTTTIPNVLLNLPDDNEDLKKNVSQVTFYSGDWSKYSEVTKDMDKFDVILTSETIYNPSNYKRLIDVFKGKLRNGGVVLLAAKIYYFGVGGGVRDFEESLKNDGTFVPNVVWQSTSGVHREIIEIKFKDVVE